MRVFADTYFYLALLSPRDFGHEIARRWLRASNIQEVVITSWILVELADAMHLPQERKVAASFIADLRKAVSTQIVPASEALLERGLALYSDRTDKAWSLTDCLSFVVMKEERLTDALSADHHFTQAGFRALMRS